MIARQAAGLLPRLHDQARVIRSTATVISSRQDPPAADAACRLRTRPVGGPQQPAEKPVTRDTDGRGQHPARLPLYPWGVGLYKPPRAPMQRVGSHKFYTSPDRGRELALPSPTSRKQLKEQLCKHLAIVIMRRPGEQQ